MSISPFIKAAGLGIVAGMRCMGAPALVSNRLARTKPPVFGECPLSWLAAPAAACVLGVLAVGELVGDKLPTTPARIAPGPLVARAVSGGLCGAALFAAEDEDIALGALTGAMAAVASAFAFYHLRRSLGEATPVPDAALGLAEDLLAVSIGLAALNSQ